VYLFIVFLHIPLMNFQKDFLLLVLFIFSDPLLPDLYLRIATGIGKGLMPDWWIKDLIGRKG